MDYIQPIQTIYDYLYNKIYKKSFKLDLSVNNQRKQLDNFIAMLGQYYDLHSIGPNFLIDYFCYSFSQWTDRVTQRDISLSWIVGKKAVLNFVNRTSGQQYYATKFLSKYNINIDKLRDKFEEDNVKQNKIDIVEESEKKRFTGEARLFNCISHTTLYNSASFHCVTCPMRNVCKNILKSSNRLLYEKRVLVK